MVNGSNIEKITCALRSNKTQLDASGFQFVPIFSYWGFNVINIFSISLIPLFNLVCWGGD